MKKIYQIVLLISILSLSSFTFSFAQSFNNSSYPELCSVLNRTLQVGDIGDDVRRLQVVMGQEGIAYLSSTGFYGNATAASVRTFQRRNGIFPVGKVGPQTLRVMRSLWCGGVSSSNPSLPNPGWGNGQINWNNNLTPDVSLQPISSAGNNVTISWNTRAVNSCSLRQDNGNFQNLQSSTGQQIFSLFGESRFTLRCFDTSGREYSRTIVVRPNQTISSLPTINVSINPSQLVVGQTANLFWTSNNTTYCTSSVPNNTSNLPTSGSIPVVIFSNSQAFTFTCFNQNGQSVSQTITTNSNQILTPTINNFSYENQLLTWGTSNVNSCTLSGNGINNSNVQTNGSQYIATPNTNTTWTLNCFGNNNQSVTRQVNFNSPICIGGNCGTNQNLSIVTNLNKSVYNAGESITITTTVTNNSNTVATFPSGSSSCPSDVRLNVNGLDFYTYTNQQNRPCTADFRTENLQPGQSLTRTFTGTIPTNNTSNQIIVITSMPGITTTTDTDTATIQNVSSSITVNISANPGTISSGQNTTLSWSSTNTTYCNLSGGTTNFTGQPVSGNIVVAPTVSTNYTVTCFNNNGQNANATINVNVSGSSNNLNNSFSISLSTDKTSYSVGENVTFTIVARNNTNTNLTYNEPFCDQFYNFTINGQPVFPAQTQCLAIGFTTITLTPNQTKTYTFTVPGTFSNITNSTGNKSVNFRFFPTSTMGTININQTINVLVNASQANNVINLSSTNVNTSQNQTISWNFTATTSTIGEFGVLLSLFDSNNNYIGDIVELRSGTNLNVLSRTYVWNEPGAVYNLSSDARFCLDPVNGKYCGPEPRAITSGVYKIRASFFTGIGIQLGFTNRYVKTPVGTLESQLFTINSI